MLGLYLKNCFSLSCFQCEKQVLWKQ